MADLSYPIGKFSFQGPSTREQRQQWIAEIAEAPPKLRAAVAGLSPEQLDTPYRPGGWTVRQVVHHVPDSHMNAYIRMKWAMTEDTPAIKTYEEQLWAELPEAKSGQIDMSLALLDALHRRWVAFLRLIPEAHFRRAFLHPEWGSVAIEEAIAMYAWHCDHHAAHIRRGIGD